MARWSTGTRQRVHLVLAFLLPIGTALAGCGSDSSGPGGGGGGTVSDSVLALEPIITGLNTPIFLTAPAGDPRLFIAEKDGVIRVYKNGAVLPTPFLDLTSLTTKGPEQGLLGMAFDPNYATNGRFYVSYTTDGPTGGGTSVIARYHVSADPDVANAASDTTILTAAQPETNHNGGGIAFGPDGMLYIGFGDGGGGGDTFGNGQDRTELLGGMLRLNVSGATYTSPASNPFAASGTFRHEIWNWGLRNPWRWSFDRQTGALYIGDVGQNEWEEIDVQPAASSGGENYGWNVMEGKHCYSPSSGCSQTGLTLPVLEYSHSDGCAVVGGYVYRGRLVPAIQGLYFYSDNCSGFIRSFRYSGGQATEQKLWTALQLSAGVYSFGEDGAGELYVMTSSDVYKFQQPPAAP